MQHETPYAPVRAAGDLQGSAGGWCNCDVVEVYDFPGGLGVSDTGMYYFEPCCVGYDNACDSTAGGNALALGQ